MCIGLLKSIQIWIKSVIAYNILMYKTAQLILLLLLAVKNTKRLKLTLHKVLLWFEYGFIAVRYKYESKNLYTIKELTTFSYPDSCTTLLILKSDPNRYLP